LAAIAWQTPLLEAQRQAVQPEGGIVSVHGDLVEEGVHWRADDVIDVEFTEVLRD